MFLSLQLAIVKYFVNIQGAIFSVLKQHSNNCLYLNINIATDFTWNLRSNCFQNIYLLEIKTFSIKKKNRVHLYILSTSYHLH